MDIEAMLMAAKVDVDSCKHFIIAANVPKVVSYVDMQLRRSWIGNVGSCLR